jgi:hypothetical protein
MLIRLAGVSLLACLMTAGGCASDGSSAAADSSTSAAKPDAAAADAESGHGAFKIPDTAAGRMFGQLTRLAGTWEMTDENGQKMVGSVYRVIAGGSAVSETMFPGSEHEMVNMYHLDGDRLLVTHYCAGANQPRMAATTQPDPKVIAFGPDSVTNLSAQDAEYMGGGLELVMPDENTLVQSWTSMKSGQRQGSVSFNLTRRRT